MNIPNDDSGRRRAALRVKQRRRQDEKTWSPSGKLKANRNRRPTSNTGRRRPTSSSSSNRRPSSRPSHEKPWNDRFIHEDETVLEHATQANQKKLGSARRNVDGKENNTKDVSTSPFDLDKVNASLEADAAANDPLRQTPTHESSSSLLHTPHQTSNEQLTNPLFSMPLDKDKVKAVLENCADILYTIELEEELLRRDVASRDHQTHQSITNSDCTERREERSEQHIPIRTEPQRIQVPPEKREQIISYINQCKHTSDQQQQYQEIAEILAKEILDECIADIAEELYGHDRVKA